jgi:hypothetical protein
MENDARMNSGRDNVDDSYGLSVREVYDRHVQQLYKYGMYVCGDRALVLNTIKELFILMHRQGALTVSGPTLRFCLFKRVRDLIFKHVESDNSPTIFKWSGYEPTQRIDRRGSELSAHQHEAVFLKLYCEFSYDEVAAIMRLDIDSSHELVSQALEILQRSGKHQTTEAPAGESELKLIFNAR